MSVKRLIWAPEGTDVEYVDDIVVLEYSEDMYKTRPPWRDLGSQHGPTQMSEWHEYARQAKNPADATAAAHGVEVETTQVRVRSFRYVTMNVVKLVDKEKDLFTKQMFAMAFLWQEQFGPIKGYVWPKIIVQSIESVFGREGLGTPVTLGGMMLEESHFISERRQGDNNEDSIGKGCGVGSLAPPAARSKRAVDDESRGHGV